MQFSQTKEREDNMISTEVTKTRRRGHLAVATIAEDSMNMNHSKFMVRIISYLFLQIIYIANISFYVIIKRDFI